MKKAILILCGLALFASPVLAVTVTTTEVPYSTFSTEARKLCRFFETNNIALAYTDWDGIYYIASPDLGTTWSAAQRIAPGEYPSMAGYQYSGPADGTPGWHIFVSYHDSLFADGGSNYYLRRASGYKYADPLPPLSWTTGDIDVVYGGWEKFCAMSPPAIVRGGDGSQYLTWERMQGFTVPGGLVWTWTHCLLYGKFDDNWNQIGDIDTIFKETGSGERWPWALPASPSICTDGNNVPHVVWSLRDTVWYSSREGGSWSIPFDVSGFYTPASSAFIDFWGDLVSVVWEAPDPFTGKYDIIKRDKLLIENEWGWASNVSNTPDNDSRWAQVRAKNWVAWSESLSANNWDILLKDLSTGTLYNISNNTTTSKYSQMEFWQDVAGAHPAIAWTDQTPAPVPDGAYSILFWTSTFSAAKYYSVEVGQVEASPYTLYRDGYITYPSGISIDWASNELVYRLPYLLSDYDYTLVVVGYHESKGKWNAQVKLDGREARVLKVEAGVPDTVKMEIPLPYYENDKEIELRVRRLTGDFAGVCDVTLYQFERASKGGGGAQLASKAEGRRQKAEFRLMQNAPNPFSSQTAICYSLSAMSHEPSAISHTTLKIYNIAGQLVRTLVDETKSAGSHSITWDRKDNSGKEVPAGVYFYRLNAGAETETKRMVVVR